MQHILWLMINDNQNIVMDTKPDVSIPLQVAG